MTEAGNKRYFTIAGSGTNIAPNTGRYVALGPSQAGKKAGARLFRELSESEIKRRESNGKIGIKFILRETTRNSKKGTFYYLITRKVLSNPTQIKIGDKIIEYKYDYNIEKSDASVVEKDVYGTSGGMKMKHMGGTKHMGDMKHMGGTKHMGDMKHMGGMSTEHAGIGGKKKSVKKNRKHGMRHKGGDGEYMSDEDPMEYMEDTGDMEEMEEMEGGGRRKRNKKKTQKKTTKR
jgi:hypothetical protein